MLALKQQVFTPLELEQQRVEREISAAEGQASVIVREEVSAHAREWSAPRIEEELEQRNSAAVFAAALLLGDAISARLLGLQTDAAAAQNERLSVDHAFDPFRPATARQFRQSREEFTRNFNRQQRDALRNALRTGRQAGDSTAQIAARMNASFGLTPQITDAVGRYEKELRASQLHQALARGRRDKRFDPTLVRAIHSGNELGDRRIRRMAERYRERLGLLRVDTISRHEGALAVNRGAFLAIDQAVTRGDLDPDLVEQAWRTTVDGHERPSHNAMNGQVRLFGEPFTSGAGASLRFPHDPRAPLSEILGCRCGISTRVKATSD